MKETNRIVELDSDNPITLGFLLSPHGFMTIDANTEIIKMIKIGHRYLNIKEIFKIKDECSNEDKNYIDILLLKNKKETSFEDYYLIKNFFGSLLATGKAVPFYYIYPVVDKINNYLLNNHSLNSDELNKSLAPFEQKYSMFFNFIYETYLIEKIIENKRVEKIKSLFEKNEYQITHQGIELAKTFLNNTGKKTVIHGTDYIYSFLRKDIFKLISVIKTIKGECEEVRCLREQLYPDANNHESLSSLNRVITNSLSYNSIEYLNTDVYDLIEFIEYKDPYFLLIDCLTKTETFKESTNLAFYIDDKSYYYKVIFPLCFKTEVVLTEYIETNFKYMGITKIIDIICKILKEEELGEAVGSLTRISDANKEKTELEKILKSIDEKKLSTEKNYFLKFLIFRNYLAHHSYQDDFFLSKEGCREVVSACVISLYTFFTMKDDEKFIQKFSH